MFHIHGSKLFNFEGCQMQLAHQPCEIQRLSSLTFR